MNELVCYDIKKPCPSWVLEAFEECLCYIQTSSHHLKNNYTTKELKLEKMCSFTVVVNQDHKDVVCFSGLQINSWKYNIARISSRHFFSDKYASKYLRKRINWKMCVVDQIKTGIKLGYNKMFFSTELMHNRMFNLQCYNSTKAINTILPNIKILPLKDYYDTTGKPSWQRIGKIVIDNIDWQFPLEKRENNEY